MMRALVFLLLLQFPIAASPVVLSEGRFRPIEAHAKQWQTHYKQSDQNALPTLWKVHFLGVKGIENDPFIYIYSSKVKEALSLPLKQMRFSLSQLKTALNRPTAPLKTLLLEAVSKEYAAAKSGKNLKELSTLSPKLFVKEGKGFLTVQNPGKNPPWNLLYPGDKISQGDTRAPSYVEEFLDVVNKWETLNLKEMEKGLLIALPPKGLSGNWLPLDRILERNNPTGFSDAVYQKIRHHYQKAKAGFEKEGAWDLNSLTASLEEGYGEIAGKPYLVTASKVFTYPSTGQIKTESFYFNAPLIETCIALYLIALVLLYFFPKQKVSFYAFLLAAFCHLTLLGIRTYVLMRPPVSNMFETLLYVPLILALASLLFHRSLLPLAAFGALILLLILKVSNLENSMENVQAVLDSQFWLTIHVLMIVGSYGIFLLGGVLAHWILLRKAYFKLAKTEENQLTNALVQTLYLGLFLLIPGTILGGVWAAESWGRFWDWDPKESWAFITSCVYLVVVHAYRFGKVSSIALANGAVVGTVAVTFTWYGVNYLLGTGLHSYGFGEGGHTYYFAYLALEAIFLLVTNLQIVQKVDRKSL